MAALEKQAKSTAENKDKERATVDKLTKDIAEKERKRNDLEKGLNSTKLLDELNEQEVELQRNNEDDQPIIDAENTSPSERKAAEGRVAKHNEEIARLQRQIKERERALPLRERIKEIFKKTWSDVDSDPSCCWCHYRRCHRRDYQRFESNRQSFGKRAERDRRKTASLLPGMLGSIVSFLFKAAGQAIGFLAEHTWLLILAVVAFLMESYIKKRR